MKKILIILFILFLSFYRIGNAAEGIWIDLKSGAIVSQKELLEDLSKARIIYLGEVHTLHSHHKAQFELLKLLYNRHIPLALALESLEAKDQKIIDQFINGQLSFKQFSEAIQWKKKWPNYLDYKPLCLFAQKHHIPLIGIDTPHSIVSNVARKGYNSITKKEKAEFPLATITPLYRRFLTPYLSVHAFMDKKRIALAIEAQRLRESSMAKHILSFLNSPLGSQRTICVVTGEIHVRYGLGIPQLTQPFAQRILLFGSKEPLHLSKREKQISKQLVLDHQSFSFIPSTVADYFEVLAF
ncbi:hypothetical protein A7K73_07630 [Candidatus Methylacidiphilum fumarolicum]|uniref:Uncharacterized iron-regulated protein n=2 Tax=Candidatus Methylacidiphilum fumarolicum TaxID=591154 RepID=I0K1I8_METFB|nr:ChaN family lipoprotein [Candidatus Methylacidiphilum fumarolicum]TFE68546.1 hypothetical protein A7K73_07630 [Candidatus Methylacidiphilum fumarolicum]TFE76491.1 hypothetical protein A7D33_09850 [Candidatus Methylacidiphilum fumarolicum]CAI9084481.1 Uncharacterized iron-regulated protein [Candidatus Methylacidiphilum fumarolicum]CCG93357.1 Uncharacterized iron-regulated protein [Methylacidiphilum fumariolicum SolV]